MATSVLMAADHQTPNPNTPLPFPQNHHDHDNNHLNHPIRRSSGRRKPKGCDTSSSELNKKKNKTPQRGMGVEKLERLRLQERWKKMTEINTNNNIPPAVSFPDPISKLGGFNGPRLLAIWVFMGKWKKKVNVGDCGFLGLNIGEYQNKISQENQGLNIGTKAVGNGKQGVELVAVHRKGSSSSDGVMMEYEFFPSGKGYCRSSDHDSEICLSSSSMELGFDDINGSSSCVDLSLKLSYY
ncbi:hypothetical protein DH2020_031776 [Rehmannia glutinosa]|uniref:Uncharacterized protein n=1 Tax=Rehmannia glutinosa TaxID=99300 RepID=A0ABR0VKK9_REHGL